MGRFRDAWAALTGKRSIVSADSPWADILAADATSTGLNVSPDTSLRVSAVYAGVRLLAESVSSLPVDIVRREGNRSTEVDHPVGRLVTHEPNPEMDAAEMWRTIMGWMLLEGNAYLYIERGGGGTPAGLWPLPANSVTVGRDTTRRPYFDVHIGVVDHRYPGVPLSARLGPEDVLHYRAFGTGMYGLSPIRQIREAIGTAVAAQRYMAKFYANDASPGGFISVPENLTDEQHQRMEASWKSAHQGLDRAHLTAILEGGAKWETVGLNPGDAAFIETQRWEVAEIARALGVPPHLIGDVDRSTSWGSGIAEQGIGFVTYTLTPWITRLEQVTRRGLLTEIDSRWRAKWRVEGLQRGDAQSRYQAYAVGRQWGWLSTNDVRQLEDMDPVPDGDVYLQPLNMVPAGQPRPVGDDGEPRQWTHRRSGEARRRIASSFAPLIVDADRRLAKMERQEVTALARKHLESRSVATFLEAVRELYEGTIAQRTRERWLPIFEAFVAEVVADAKDDVGFESEVDLLRWVEAYVRSHVSYRVGSAISQLSAAIAEADAAFDATTGVLDEWVEQRPERTARWQGTQLANAAARETWRAAGVRSLRWVTVGDNCPFCRSMNGTTVGIEEPFVPVGGAVTGLEEKLQIDRDTHHPPLHPGCDCEIVPG